MDIRLLENLESIVEFKKKLKKKSYPNSTKIAIETAKLFEGIIIGALKGNNIKSFSELLKTLRELGKGFISIDPLQFSVGNIIKRVLHIVREEYNKFYAKESFEVNDTETKKKRLRTMTSLNTLIDYTVDKIAHTPKISAKSQSFSEKEDEDGSGNFNLVEEKSSSNLVNEELKEHVGNVLQNIDELINELESISDLIKDQSHEHINDNDIILTANHSDQLEEFFIEAAKKKTFHVIVAESAPTLK